MSVVYLVFCRLVELVVPFLLVALGDHVPSDVAGGALLAFCLVAAG